MHVVANWLCNYINITLDKSVLKGSTNLLNNASYKNLVDALDEMQILNIGTYVIDKLNPDDEKLLKSAGVKE